MGRKVKCQYCGEKDEKDDMTVVEKFYSKSVKRSYFHKEDCYKKFIEEKAFKEQEKRELDELAETIMKVHDIDLIPKQFYPYIQDLRNGSVLFGNVKKSYKNGFSYTLIKDTYNYCIPAIEWAKKNKQFDGTVQELKYCLAIVCDKIDQVKSINKRKEIQKHEEKRIEEQAQNLSLTETKYNKRDDDLDISDLL